MRYRIGTLAAVAALTAGVVAGTGAAAAHAQPARPTGLYAPSELVLTVAKGMTPATATVQRAVTLRCAPTPGGDHPAPAEACAELGAANGDFTALTNPDPGRMCMQIWSPVVLTAEGVWNGQRVSYNHTYPNSCIAQNASRYVFEF